MLDIMFWQDHFFYEKGLKREVRKLSPLLDISKSENENWL